MHDVFWQKNVLAACTEKRQLSGKSPLLLDDPATVWAILEGRAEVYAVRVRDGKPAGARRHLFTACAGDLLPGLGLDAAGQTVQIVGLPGTLAARFNADRLFAGAEDPRQPEETTEAARLLDRFLFGLCAGLSRDVASKPAARHELTSGLVLSLSGRAALRPNQGVWWLRPVSAAGAHRESPAPALLYLGLEEIDATPPAPIGVLTPETWIESVEPDGNLAVEVLDTATLLARRDARKAFERFAGLFYRSLATELRLIDVDSYGAMLSRNQAAGRSRAAGLQQLEEVDDAKREPGRPAGEYPSPLVAACAMVVRATGITVPETHFQGNERLEEIADGWGVKHRSVTLRNNWWKRDGGPLLGFLREGGETLRNRPVALLQPKTGRYAAYDLVTGKRFRLNRWTARRMASQAVSYYRPFPDKPLGLLDLIRYTVAGSRSDFIYILICGIALSLLAVLPPVGVKLIYSDAIPSSDRSLLMQTVTLFTIVALSMFTINLARLAAHQRMVGKMDFHLEPAFWERLISLPAGFHRKEGPGELADRIDGLNVVRIRLCDVFLNTLLSGIFASCNAVMLFVFGPGLALPALGLLLIGALTGVLFNLRQIGSWRDHSALQGRITSMLVQFFSGITKIRLSGSENHVFGQWANSFATQQKLMMRAGREQNLLLVFNLVFPVGSMMLLFTLAGGTSGPMPDAGSFLAFLASYLALQTALISITNTAVEFSAVLPLYQRLKPILETVPENSRSLVDPGRLQGKIELAGIQFRYDPEGPLILDGINLEIKPGEFVALVGPSGSGKSTVLRLLLGFEAPGSGSIRYDDKDLATLDVRKLRRRNLGVVMQGSSLLPGDILFNIIGERNLGEEDAWEAARQAGIDDDIRLLPAGIRTPIGEGCATFSAGQKQRLCIARALAGQPSILLLDEATSALDNRTQEIVTRSLDAQCMTRVVVAHRLSTVRNADRIVLLEAGRILESGSYAELMERRGRFHDLVKRQLLKES